MSEFILDYMTQQVFEDKKILKGEEVGNTARLTLFSRQFSLTAQMDVGLTRKNFDINPWQMEKAFWAMFLAADDAGFFEKGSFGIPKLHPRYRKSRL